MHKLAATPAGYNNYTKSHIICQSKYTVVHYIGSQIDNQTFMSLNPRLALFSTYRCMIYPLLQFDNAFEIHYVFKNIMENGVFALGANAPFSIIFSKVFKTSLKFFLIFFQCCLKIENDVMI